MPMEEYTRSKLSYDGGPPKGYYSNLNAELTSLSTPARCPGVPVEPRPSYLPLAPFVSQPLDRTPDHTRDGFFGPARQVTPLFCLANNARLLPAINIHADRGFFQEGGVWTCYRRNYFQINGAISVAYHDPQVNNGHVFDDNPATGVACFLANGSAVVKRFYIKLTASSGEGGALVDLVQHTPQRDKGPKFTPRDRDIHLCSSLNANSVTLFERLQFKNATTNNGKRRALQQFFTLRVELMADLGNGIRQPVAYSTSQKIVVRGRSPGHYRSVKKPDSEECEHQLATVLPPPQCFSYNPRYRLEAIKDEERSFFNSPVPLGHEAVAPPFNNSYNQMSASAPNPLWYSYVPNRSYVAPIYAGTPSNLPPPQNNPDPQAGCYSLNLSSRPYAYD